MFSLICFVHIKTIHFFSDHMSSFCKPIIKQYRGDIKRGGSKMWILFSSGKTIFHERAQRVSKILFLARENKIHLFKPPFNVLFII